MPAARQTLEMLIVHVSAAPVMSPCQPDLGKLHSDGRQILWSDPLVSRHRHFRQASK